MQALIERRWLNILSDLLIGCSSCRLHEKIMSLIGLNMLAAYDGSIRENLIKLNKSNGMEWN